MITSKDLRLGNYVIGFYEDEEGLEENEDILFEAVCRVTSLDCSGFLDFNIYVESDDCNVEVYEKFEGIDLTEEWLIKLGLKKIEEYCFELDDIHVNTKRELIWITTKCKRELEFNIPNYIHELQNLYFALTGSELTVA